MRAFVLFAPVLVFSANTTALSSSVLYQEDFDATFPSGQSYVSAATNLGAEWSFYSSTTQGRTQIYNWGGSRGGVLILHDGVNDSTYTLNEAILKLDLLGKTNVELIFSHYDSSDEEHAIGTISFTDHRYADGVAVSSNGTDWFPLVNFYQGTSPWVTYTTNGTTWLPQNNFSQSNGSWVTYAADLSGFVGANPLLQLTSQFFIKFQQYDNRKHGDDGRKFDNLLVKGMMPPDTPPGQSVVPEPTTATLFGIGLLGLTCYHRRRRARSF